MESRMHWADYTIFVGFLVISLAIGIYHSLTGGRQKTTAEFIMGNRRLKVIPTAISLLVSIVSSTMLLGTTTEMYSYGIQFLIFCIISGILSLFCIERFIVPWLFPLKLISIYDYLEMRFMSKSIRIFGAMLGMSSGLLFMGMVMYAPSAALESANGLPLAVSIPAMAAVAITYTALGGMRAVIWTDVFQFVTMVAGMIAVFVKGLIVAGGITNVFRLAGEEGRLVWANFSIDPRERHTVWSLMIGMGMGWISSFGLSQAAVQRYSAVDKLSKARATMLLIIPPVVVMNGMAGIIGLIVLAHYSSIKCDPLVNKDITNSNMLLPYFVVTIFADSPGFSGLFLSTLYGAALSGAAANCWEDILKWKLNHLPEDRKTFINKLLVVLFGVIAVGIAFFIASIPGPIIQVLVAMQSSVSGPMIGLFVLGAVSKHANWKGTLLGGILGIMFTFWLNIGSMTVKHKHPPLPPVSVEYCSLTYTNYTHFEVDDGIWAKNNWNETTEVMPDAEQHVIQIQGLENFYAISYRWFLPIGAIVTGIIGILASLIMKDRDLEAKVDERLLMRFNICGWSDANESQEHLEDGNMASLQETKGLKEHEDDFLNGYEMTVSNKTENWFPQGNQK